MDQMTRIEGLPLEGEPTFALKLPSELINLVDDPVALTHGMIAIGVSFDTSGRVLRQKAIRSMIEKLELDDFVNHQSYYKDANRTAATIIDGLCRRGYIDRWIAPMRAHNTTGPTTKGYILTEMGATELESMVALLPPVYKETIGLIVKNVRASTAKPEAEVLQKVEQNSEVIEKLANEYESLTKMLNDCRAEIDSIRSEADKKVKYNVELCDEIVSDMKQIQAKIQSIIGG